MRRGPKPTMAETFSVPLLKPRSPATTSRNHNPYVSWRRRLRVEVAGRKIPKYGIALLGIVLAGAFLRVYHLGTQSIWVDEGYSIWISQLTLPRIVQGVARGDVHPPLYYFILHYWIKIFGTSESAVRLLSVIFGVLALPMIYLVGRQLFNKEAGLVGALILALSSFNIWYSQEARMYSLMVFLGLLSMYFFWRFLQQSTLVSSVGYVLSTTLLVYTHYYGWFVVIAENIYVVTLLLLSKNRTYKLKYWVALQAMVVALFVPWMPSFVEQALRRKVEGGVHAPATIATIIDTFSRYSGTTVLLALFLGLSVLSLFAYQKVRGAMDWKAPLKALEGYEWEVRIQGIAPVYFLAVWLIAINLIPFIVSRFSTTEIYLDRYTIAASVALYVLVAKGISNINYRYAKIAVVGIIVVLSVANLQVYYGSITRPQVREATYFIDANAKSGDLVLMYPDWKPFTFDYYNNRTDIRAVPIHSTITRSEKNHALTKELQSDVTGHDRVWLFVINTAYMNSTLNSLNKSYALSYIKSYYDYNVYLMQKRA